MTAPTPQGETRKTHGWECGCPHDQKHTACPDHAISDVYLIPTAPVSPALDFEKTFAALDSDDIQNSGHLKTAGPIGPRHCEKCRLVAGGPCWDCVDVIVKATCNAVKSRIAPTLNAQAAQLVADAVAREREKLAKNAKGWKAEADLVYAPLLAAWKEWKAAREAEAASVTPPWGDTSPEAVKRLRNAEAALAAWEGE